MDPEIIRKWSTGGIGYFRSINCKEFIDKINIDDPTERVMLGQCYEYGVGVEKDQIEAVRLYKLSQHNSYGQARLGVCYEHGKGGIIKDEKEAARLYRLSAEQNNSYGQAFLGVCYYHGKGGLSVDEKEAVRLYRKSVYQNNSTGQVALAHCYEYGKGGLPENEKEAVRLYKLSTEQHNSYGQFRLAHCYEYGKGGLPVDVAIAVRLYKLSAEQHNSNALDHLEQLKKTHPELFYKQKPFSQETIHVNDESCSICLEEFIGVPKAVTVLQCTHKYHFCCLTRWFKSQPLTECPLCKSFVNTK